ncbi:MAG: hypothetical protein COB17_11095 [Sulfurimonas sp.]|nr:MAG: hypothetical protein COB17_11095 [Sulfurimonas sp.]
MKYSLLLIALLSTSSILSAFSLFGSDEPSSQSKDGMPEPILAPTPIRIANTPTMEPVTMPSIREPLLTQAQRIRVSVIGQGVAPMNTSSPAQAYALAKRAAIADGYRLIAEKVKGVRVEGQDLIKNMMTQKSTIRTSVNAMVRNSNLVETTFKDGLCEVEMEIVLSYVDFSL